MKENIRTRFSAIFKDAFSLEGQLVTQAEAENSIRDGVSFRGMNLFILILAIFIASLGLNTNSTAVIIGAMLISPLMGPIIGIGLSVGIHDFELLKRSVRNLIMAAGFSVLTSTLFFLISPVNEQHSELLARTSPTIYDVLIGFIGGGAGILAIGSGGKGNVIPGVAIATALMPPLCTAGYGIATWQLNYFGGAFYLFVINSIYIAFATFIGVKLMNYHGVSTADNVRARKVRKVVYTVAVLTMLPSIYLTYNMLSENRFNTDVDRFIHAECRFPDTQVVSRTAVEKDGEKEITITLIGQPLPEDSLRLALSAQLKNYGLAGAKLVIIQGGYNRTVDNTSPAIGDIYRIAQATITHQQSTIDSLRNVLRANNSIDLAAPEVSPEIRILFPTVTRLGIATTVFASPGDTAAHDTATVALVHVSAPMSDAVRSKLAEYLEARLGIPDIQVQSIR